ncbi:DUF2066 domain-containing protein [Vibrio sp. SCSIO 43136]|uniref:DUF2066 domain-containing protein n=1 Tax=Vibrio sp. SCSIO 43136 TaxID=2819101 RepID=UPI002075511C|nr:DUF2066 domain-containing protein [Vibrio sp. SCSIO 43136]USD65938.1 DUF2066 domain-containing protein [Vibrio sp. SCSIO 43136]
MKRVLGWLMCALAMPSFAMTKVDLFTAEIPLSEESNAEALAQSQGLAQVLIKASGDKSAGENAVVKKALRNSGQYLTQISSSELNGQPSLKLGYNSQQVQSLLTQAGLAYWSPTRSNLLVWLVEEDGFQRQIGWEQSGSMSIAPLKQAADTRGLPLTIPVGDFDDVTAITAPDLWGGFVDPMAQASVRYPVDAVLVLRIQHRDNNSVVRWSLYDQLPSLIASSQQSPLTGRAVGSLNGALGDMVDQVSDYYAGKSAVKVSDTSTQTVLTQFVEVNNANDFFTLESMLKGLNSVASVDVMKIQGNSVRYRVHLLASLADFERELANFSQVNRVEFIEPQPVSVEEPAVIEESNDGVQPLTEADASVSDAQPLVEDSLPAPEPEQPQEPLLTYEWIG